MRCWRPRPNAGGTGSHIIFSFIVGFPGETRAQLEDTLALIKTLRADEPALRDADLLLQALSGLGACRQCPGSGAPHARMNGRTSTMSRGAAGGWVSPEVYQRVERFKFYNSMAWGPETRARRPLAAHRKVARPQRLLRASRSKNSWSKSSAPPSACHRGFPPKCPARLARLNQQGRPAADGSVQKSAKQT